MLPFSPHHRLSARSPSAFGFRDPEQLSHSPQKLTFRRYGLGGLHEQNSIPAKAPDACTCLGEILFIHRASGLLGQRESRFESYGLNTLQRCTTGAGGDQGVPLRVWLPYEITHCTTTPNSTGTPNSRVFVFFRISSEWTGILR